MEADQIKNEWRRAAHARAARARHARGTKCTRGRRSRGERGDGRAGRLRGDWKEGSGLPQSRTGAWGVSARARASKQEQGLGGGRGKGRAGEGRVLCAGCNRRAGVRQQHGGGSGSSGGSESARTARSALGGAEARAGEREKLSHCRGDGHRRAGRGAQEWQQVRTLEQNTQARAQVHALSRTRERAMCANVPAADAARLRPRTRRHT